MKLLIKKSAIGGKGSFTTRDIKKGKLITKLNGELVNEKQINKIIAEGKEHVDDPLQIDDDLFVDLDESSRLINHSCNPNAGIRGSRELFALRDIKRGEEITYDYSTTVSKDIKWEMRCNCGSRNCRKKIGNISTIPKSRIKRYLQLSALPDFIKAKARKF